MENARLSKIMKAWYSYKTFFLLYFILSDSSRQFNCRAFSEFYRKRGGFRDIPIDGSLQVGDIVYTKANAVLDIGMVKSVNPLEVYSRCTRYDYGYPSLYGAPELCRWYNSGVNVSFIRWKEISYDAGTDDVCRAIGIPYLRC